MRSHILLPVCVSLALLLQSLVPSFISVASKAGYDVSVFICSPSGQAPSNAAQAHMDSLIALLSPASKNRPDVPQTEHCASCVITIPAVFTAPQMDLTRLAYAQKSEPFIQDYNSHNVSARGPPVGGRAPPLFL